MKTARSSWILAAFVFLSCTGKWFAVEPNPENCNNDVGLQKCKDSGGVCDTRTGQCSLGFCSSSVNCPMTTASFCNAGQCVPCSVDTQCIVWGDLRNETPRRRWCASLDSKQTCVQCRAGMDAVDCTDPAKPACDAKEGLCRGCQADSECASGVCRKKGDYPTTSPVPGLMEGQCVPDSNIAYVNNSSTPTCNMSNPGTQAQPVCTVAQAMMLPNKQYINVAGSGTTYGVLTVSSGSFVVVGAGRDRTAPNATMFDQVIVNNGGSLVLSGVQIKSMSGIPAVQCSSAGAPSSLYLLDCTVEGTGAARGVDGQAGCGQLNIERSRVTAGRLGISITGTGRYRIVNTAVSHLVQGGSGGEPYGVNIGSGTSGYFGFNTVTRFLSGVTCGSNQALEDSIVAGNGGTQVDSCDTSGRTYSGALSFPATLEPKLSDTAAFQTCCIDKGLPPAPESVPTDYYGTTRPQRGNYDIGYHELPPQ